MRRLVGALALASLLAGCDRSPPAEPPRAAQTATTTAAPSAAAPSAVTSSRATRAPLERVELVKGGAAGDALPLIVALHGLGDDARNFAGVFDGLAGPARVVVLQAPTRHGSGWSWFATRRDAGSVSVHADGVAAAADLVAEEVRALAASRPTKGKPVVTGFSQGGMISFALALRHGELITRAVPVAGWLPEALWPTSRPPGAAPIYALHGDADDVLPLAPTRAGVAHLAKLGLDVELREVPGVRHTISREERALWFAALLR